MFMKNAWYVAAWSEEVRDSLFHRKILDEPVLLYRKADGSVVGMHDRCPHRFAPLHLGKLKDDTVQCGYHGLCFNARGECVSNPTGAGAVPKAARVRSFPVLERDQFIWIWMGDAEKADPALIPDFSLLSSPDWTHATGGYLHGHCHYEMFTDNLLDLSHVNFLHPLFGDESMTHGQQKVTEKGRTVQCDLWIPNTDVPGYLQPALGSDIKIDQWLDMTWTAASNLMLSFGGTPAGKTRDEGTWGWAAHVLTPETSRSSHYFFSMSLRGPGAAEAVKQGHETQKRVFENEDKPMVQACQEMMGDADFWSLKPVLLANDAGAIRVRRLLRQLIEAEQGAA
ncbi:MAG: Rieske 2Fe-2S domain-containing protein [Pirellulaceae bacterium]